MNAQQASDMAAYQANKNNPGRVPPQNLEAEESVLGAILLDPQALNRAVELLVPADFYREAHRMLFEGMRTLYERGQSVDLVTLSNFLAENPRFETLGGASMIAALTHVVPSSANISHHAKIVKEKAVLRDLISKTSEIIQRSYETPSQVEEFLDEAEKIIFSISEGSQRQSYFSVKDIVKDSIKAIEERASRQDAITGVPSGFKDLDKLTCGFQPSDLVIIAGRPSMGKTAFCLNMAAYAAAEKGIPCLFFSLEMSKEQLVMRLLCSEARIESNRLRTGQLDDDDWKRLIRAAGKLSELPLYIDDTPAISTTALRSKTRRLKKEKDVKMVMIDYLQLMRRSQDGYSESREREISEISRSLKALAKELSIPVIALSQLNRSVESRIDKRPMNSDLRESGALEQDADLIGFIYRDEVYNKDTAKPGVAEFILGKQRNGPIGTVELTFLHQYTRFANLER